MWPFIFTNLNSLQKRVPCIGQVFLTGKGNLFLGKGYVLSFEYIWILFTQVCFAPSLVEIWLKLAQWFWRRGFFLISSMYFPYFVIISPLKRVGTFIWRNLNPLHPRMLLAKFGWNWPGGSGEEDFLISSMYFRYFVIISPWKRLGPFIWRNLNPLHTRMLCAKFGWNWPSGSGEEDF